MSDFDNGNLIKLLQNLLTKNESSDSEAEDSNVKTTAKFINPNSTDNTAKRQTDEQPSTSSTNIEVNASSLREKTVPKTFDEWEKQENIRLEDELEHRQTPEYHIIYKQSVSPEDIYLHIGNKTAATSSCEQMCIEILMQNENVGIDQMELEVNPNWIDLKTPVYRLKLPLVQTIDPDFGNAKWDSEQKILRLYLVMKREYDCINF